MIGLGRRMGLNTSRFMLRSNEDAPILAPASKHHWLDAADESTIADTLGSVTSWTDKFNANVFSQGTFEEQPLTGNATRNGRNIIDFDSNLGAWLRCNAFHTPLVQPFTIITVIRQTRDSFIRWAYGYSSNGSTSSAKFGGSDTDEYAMNAGATLLASTTRDLNFHIFTCEFNGANSTIRKDGGAPVATGNAGTGGATAGTIGIQWELFQQLEGFYAEQIAYNDLLTTSEHDGIGDRLASKWDLTWNGFTV